MITANDMLPKLVGVKASGRNQWTARCPAHENKKGNSLSMAQAGDKLLIHCFAGCTFNQIIAACGLAKDNKTPPPVRHYHAPEPVKNIKHLGEMWAMWTHQTSDMQLAKLAEDLGVSVESLRSIGTCWAWPHEAWGFPMHNHAGEFIGMRLRSISGDKWAVPGSHQGLFLCHCKEDPFCIVEGPTDLAALITMGICGMGRPSCNSAVKETTEFCKINKIHPYIVSDADGPGLKGAQDLCRQIKGSKLAMLPAKDTRDFLKTGGTKDMFMSSIMSAREFK